METAMDEEIKVGDPVQQLWGGPVMVVTDIGEVLEEQMVSCAWFVEGKRYEERFLPASLKKVIMDR
jgi:uncharacterized protein YodC (DUF2158 family)